MSNQPTITRESRALVQAYDLMKTAPDNPAFEKPKDPTYRPVRTIQRIVRSPDKKHVIRTPNPLTEIKATRAKAMNTNGRVAHYLESAEIIAAAESVGMPLARFIYMEDKQEGEALSDWAVAKWETIINLFNAWILFNRIPTKKSIETFLLLAEITAFNYRSQIISGKPAIGTRKIAKLFGYSDERNASWYRDWLPHVRFMERILKTNHDYIIYNVTAVINHRMEQRRWEQSN